MGFLCLKLCCLVGPVCHLSKCKAKNAIFSRQSRNLSFSVYSRSVPPFQYFANSQYQIFRDFKTKIELILEGNFDGVRILYPVVKCSIFWRFITIARSNAIQHHQYFTFLLTHYFPVHFCTSLIFVKKFNFNQTLVLMPAGATSTGDGEPLQDNQDNSLSIQSKSSSQPFVIEKVNS